MFGRGSYFGVHGAEIDVPAALADVVGVADGIAELRPLAADITDSWHNSLVPSGLMPRVFLIRIRNLILQECREFGHWEVRGLGGQIAEVNRGLVL